MEFKMNHNNFNSKDHKCQYQYIRDNMMVLRVRCLIFYLIFYNLIPPNLSDKETTQQRNFFVTEPNFGSQGANVEENSTGTSSVNSSNMNSEQRSTDTSSRLVLSNGGITEYVTTTKNSPGKGTDNFVTTQEEQNTRTSTSSTVISDNISNELPSQIDGISGTTEKADICAIYGTCEHVSGFSRIEFKYCRCDEMCQIYNDCCFDANVTNISNLPDKIAYECIPFSNAYSYFGLYVITKCPDSFQKTDIDSQCRTNDLLTFGPWVMDETGVVYQNKFCAECHGKESYRPFSIKISNVNDMYNINNKTTVQKLQSFIEKAERFIYRIDQVPPEGSLVRHCFIYNSESKSTECLENYNNPVIVPLLDSPFFRNRYCAPKDAREVFCLGPFAEQMYQLTIKQYGLYPLSVLFVFEETNNKCLDSINGLCIGKEMHRNFTIEFSMELTTSRVVSDQETTKILMVFLWSLPNFVKPLKLRVGTTDEMHNASFTTGFLLESVIDKNVNEMDKIEYKSMLNTYHLEAEVKFNNSTFFAFIVHNHDNYITQSSLVLGTEAITEKIKKVKVDLSTSTASHLFCIEQFVKIDLHSDSTVSVELWKCLEEIVLGKTTEGTESIKTVFTFVGMAVSVIALTVCIVIYRLAGLHKSVSGSNTENLCISLLLSNVLFIVGVGAYDYWYVCYVVGVCLHYLWLSVFSFMSITLVHMSHVFMKMSSSISNQVSTNRRFTILGLLLPTPFIISSVTLDLLNVSGFESNYAGNICFPTGYPASILFMSGPIGLSIVVNIICFICTACVISSQSHQSKLIKKSNPYQYIGVYARLCIITGIFWITAVLGVLFQTDVVEYIFIILCSLQGFFVALANLTTRRVLRIIRNYFVVEQESQSRVTIKTN